MLSLLPLTVCSALIAQPTPMPSPGEPMQVTCGNDVGWQVVSPEEGMAAFRERGELRRDTAAVRDHWDRVGGLYAEHGVTAFEPYVKWMLLEPEEGVWDPEFYDAELAEFKRHGLKWVPFLIAGPAYATPPWFKESDESVFAVDLVTGDVSRDQSIWNPHLRPRIRAWLERFFAHYDHADMQAVLLGISGVFGESIYTAGGNIWTWIWDGEYPQHFGWWCGDPHAAESFRAAMRAKYPDIAALNAAWRTDYASFEEVAPFAPDASHPDRARLDMVRWYMGSMTEHAEWWTRTVRELAPDVPILMCTGGGADPELGADMSAQTRMVAKYGAGMRITNEASNYAMNFHITRHISSAARLYGTYFGYEPAGEVTEDGIVARVYNAVAAGAQELFHYDNPPSGARGDRYKRHLDLLRAREPVVEVALFWPRTSVDLHAAGGLAGIGGAARDICDLDYVDELMIEDGALDGLRVLVWGDGPVTEHATAERIRAAVEAGLTLVVPRGLDPRSPEGEWLFPADLIPSSDGMGSYPVAALSDRPSERAPWREGLFHGPEPDGRWNTNGTVCWTGGTVTLHIPLPAEACRVTLPYWVGHIPEPGRVLADGEFVQALRPNETASVLIDRPAAAPGANRMLELRLECGSWVPADAGENDDTRHLAVMLRDVTIGRPGKGDTADFVPITASVPVGAGRVIVAARGGSQGLSEALASLITRPADYGFAGLSPEASIDAKPDQLYLAVTTEDILLYNHTGDAKTIATPTGEVMVPGHSIVSVPRG